ncbi:uncharacterized protein LOC142356923 [Convolutriloba macropyga]|uniref:uncharacterized protein LOC142356923 n=1 Tax=Convolutriloba macropyga TaxID=536237 RepID=UPI003F51B3B2
MCDPGSDYYNASSKGGLDDWERNHDSVAIGHSRIKRGKCDWENYGRIDYICVCECWPFLDYLLGSEEEEMYNCCVENLRDARKKDCLDLKGRKIPDNDKCSKFSQSFEKCFVGNYQCRLSVATTLMAIVATINYAVSFYND